MAAWPLDGGGAGAGPLDGGGAVAGPLDGGGAAAGPLDGCGAAAGPLDGGGAAAGPLDGGVAAAGPLDGGGAAAGPLDGSGAVAGPLDGSVAVKEKVEPVPHLSRQDCGCRTAEKRRWRPLHNSAGRTVAAALQEKEGGDRSTTLQAGLWLLHCRKKKVVVHWSIGKLLCWLYTPW